jgi:hypothetical protein
MKSLPSPLAARRSARRKAVSDAGLPAFVVVFLLIALAAMVVMPMKWSQWYAQREADIAGAPLQSGYAKVLDKTRQDQKTGAWFTITLRLDGQTASLRENESTVDGVRWTRTNVGDTVPVTYRVGRSGSVYIEDWQPPRAASGR